ncbi:Intron-binding protein aquarius [Venturia nashicola]|uniref:Intron-binding protein aquarius n=1 Tax=Venturia nashicola TaxID=86259 RepID=A0A4Z1P9N2_9PEZI|nr:Intron-binding protein aquarius [Venturia nashicola]
MAAGPVLHIFPPVEEVHRRRESFDELIRKSMDMRPRGPWPAQTSSPSPVLKTRTPRDRSHGPSASRSASSSRLPASNQAAPIDKYLIAQAVSDPREAFKALPPIQVPQSKPSISGRPRRGSSVSSRSRRMHPEMPIRRAASPPPSATCQQRESPVWPEDHSAILATAGSHNDYAIITPASAQSTSSLQGHSHDRLFAPGSAQSNRTIPTRPERRNSSRNRRRVIIPNRGNEVGSIFSPMEHYSPLEQRSVSKTSNKSRVSQIAHTPIQRQASIRSFRTNGTPERRWAMNSAFSHVPSPAEGSPTLVRANSSATYRKWTPQGHDSPAQDAVPMRSMFPVYDPNLPLQAQHYRPQLAPPSILVSQECARNSEFVPAVQSHAESSSQGQQQVYLTPLDHLGALWSCANGSMTMPDPKSYTLKMFRPSVISEKKKQQITFGPLETKPFYSLSKSHPNPEDLDEGHELLVSRHHASKEDILPVSHMQLQPPPPPTTSKSGRGSVLSDVHVAASHITTISPILATLHSLDSAAKTPQAHTLALVDPNATSPAAQRLAERAVAEANAREACTLAWTPTCPRTGKYELHHPSLGVFSIVAEGDIGAALEGGPSRTPANITIVNPFASLTPTSAHSGSPIRSIASGKTAVNEIDRMGSIIARLDLQQDILYIDAASIQQLGNLYLIDVCVSTLLSVAVAESKRPTDPGLIFAAPPPSLSVKGARSKNIKIKEMKEAKAEKEKEARKEKRVKKSKSKALLRPMSMGLGLEHLIPDEELPRFTKGILNMLGLSFRSAVWILGVGVRVMAGMVIGMTRIAQKA